VSLSLLSFSQENINVDFAYLHFARVVKEVGKGLRERERTLNLNLFPKQVIGIQQQ
jgi:hypothetical protein